jgi:serine/threonine protein kinase
MQLSSNPLGIRTEDFDAIATTISKVRSGARPIIDDVGKVSWYSSGQFRKPVTFEAPNHCGDLVIWPEGNAVLLTDSIVGSGLSKTVYLARDFFNGNRYAAALVDTTAEIDILNLLKGKRGIAQIHHSMSGQFWFRNRYEYKYFYYGELYDSNLGKEMSHLSVEDLRVIAKDLLYSLIALEGEDPKGEWIDHGDIKDENVFLKIDRTTGRVTGAFLGDFGCSGKQETREVDEETLKKEEEEFGLNFFASRETQREKFMLILFHQIKDRLIRMRVDSSLAALCADDPRCRKFMEELEQKYGSLLKKPYFHLQD